MLEFYYHSMFALQKYSKVIFKWAYDYIHFVSIGLKISKVIKWKKAVKAT